MAIAVEDRIERLSTVSGNRVIEPDIAVAGTLGDGELLPRELTTLGGLGIELTDEQWAKLTREELASIVGNGLRFEAILIGGLGYQIANKDNLADARVVYALHEIGEETRHSRLFARLLGQLQPTAKDPFRRFPVSFITRFVMHQSIRYSALFCVLILTGEEIPDLLQKLASEHEDTDPFVRAVNRYHRAEEARHLAFGRMVLPELWSEASAVERLLVRRVVPFLMRSMFDGIVHPGVYASIGLPMWRTWRTVRNSPARVALRHEALRPVCKALTESGAFGPVGPDGEKGRVRVPRGWRRLCGLDRAGAVIA
ncbi:MAG TPA: diiron oxygenase [Acidimicrobiales bacterium]|nr:diiron oxygenase [Acidimicrobiales bacterium]